MSDLKYTTYGYHFSGSEWHENEDYYAIDFDIVPKNGGNPPVSPTAKGTVIYSDHREDEYGKTVLVRHDEAGFPDYVSIYAHLHRIDVSVGQTVHITTSLGLEGKTGGQVDQHLHFALWKCANIPSYGWPSNCRAVVPEPILGRHVYEGLGWWHRINETVKLEGAHRPTDDKNQPNLAQWGTDATEDGAEINSGDKIIYEALYGDAEGGISEIRLTAYYPNWLNGEEQPDLDPETVWRIIARCDPRVDDAACDPNHWFLVWDPYNLNGEINPEVPSGVMLDVPWLPEPKGVNPPSGGFDVCLSFDIFDEAGNPRYGGAGVQCSSTGEANNENNSQPLSNETRVVRVMPYSGGLPSPDSAEFIEDITIPDGMVVSSGQSLVKTWRMENTGTTTWGSGYELVFVSGELMGAPEAINVPATSPGQTVDLSINITAPTNPGSHTGHWRLRNPQGTYFGDLIWVKINVQNQSNNITLTTDPASPAAADQVQIYARVDDFPNLRALRILVDGEPLCELGAPEITDCTWHTNGYATGQHAIVAQADDWSGPPWDDPATKNIVFELTGGGSTNHAPHRPDPISPYNWYVYYSGNSAQLCAQQNGDPDGDPVTDYYFDIYDSPETWNSGWVSNSCVTTGPLGPYTYQWRVKVRDNQGAESEWSDSWHFTLVSPDLTIDELYFEPQDGNSEQVKIRACTSGQGGVGITMRVSVNDASDGSDDGEWHIIKELGVPCFNDIDAPVWHTLGYGDGPHRVKVEAHGVDTSWDGAAVREEVYTLPHRRPASTHLVAPVPFSEDITEVIYLNSRTIEFIWDPTIRADSFTLHVSDSPNPKGDPTPIFRQSFAPTVLSHIVTFTVDYPLLYWQVEAVNDAGSNASGDQKFGIDRVAPSCTVEPLPEVSSEVVFQVSWGGSDNLAGVRTFDIQYQDSGRESWNDWLVNVPATRTFELFTGQAGHNYAFRCRATDNTSNTGDYPASADTSTLIDLSANPTTPWWNDDYSGKRNLTILNNMPGTTLPAGYPVHLHFDSGTTPTAAEIYNASQSTPPCNDLRVVHEDTTEVDRVVQNCSSSEIDIWFRSQVSIPGGTVDNTSHQLYFGNPNAGTPPGSPNTVFDPPDDANTVGLWYMHEGSGSLLNDTSGMGNNCTIDATTDWVTPAKFSGALRFEGGTDGPTVNCGSSSTFNLQTFSFETYIKRTGTAWGRIAGHLGAGQNRWLMSLNDNGTVRVTIWPCPSCGAVEFNSNTAITDTNNWHHIAFTLQNSTLKIFIDGQLSTTGTVPGGNINSATPPLTFGSAENIMRVFAELTHVRLSNVARSSFPYGASTAITNEPALVAGSLIEPPQTGSADLVFLDLRTYPNPGGGMLVEAVVQNQGDINTQNGFYADLYVDHVPGGPGDFTSSISFWVNEPITAASTVTLTTMVTDFPAAFPSGRVPGGEVSGTLYAQVDSTGVISETDDLDNIYTAGTPFCLASADAYEPDDTFHTASPIFAGDTQAHNFDSLGDTDWISFSAQAGTSYTLKTNGLGDRADTYLYIYDQDGVTELAANDDYGGTLASQIGWTAPASGTYYAAVRHWNPNIGGCSTQYEVQINTNVVYLPIMLGFTTTAAPAVEINSNLLPAGFGWVAQPVLLPPLVRKEVVEGSRR